MKLQGFSNEFQKRFIGLIGFSVDVLRAWAVSKPFRVQGLGLRV